MATSSPKAGSGGVLPKLGLGRVLYMVACRRFLWVHSEKVERVARGVALTCIADFAIFESVSQAS